jgi:hypothetical protein
MSADLDRLEAIAKAASPGLWEHDSACESVYAATGYRIADIPVAAPFNAMQQASNALHIATFSPERVLALLAVAREAKYVAYSNGFDAALPDKKESLRAALEQLEGKQ